MGALYHPPGGIIRHDAVVWGFARGADSGGAEIHPYTEVTGFEKANGRITAVETNRGRVECGQVVNATAGWSTLVNDMAGVPLPITTHILQACVTEPVKPLLDVVIVSSQMHVYISQTDRGEFVMGSEIEPWTTYRMNGTLNFLQDLTRHTLELFPQLEHARILRAWAGLCDLSPDYSPILGQTEVENFHVSAGWGTYGFKAAPIVGRPSRSWSTPAASPSSSSRSSSSASTRTSSCPSWPRPPSATDPEGQPMKSSLEIAQEAELIPIEMIAESCGLQPEEIEPYGRLQGQDQPERDRPAQGPRRTASSSA